MDARRIKNWHNLILGILVMILPFSGLPSSAKNVVFFILGFFITLFSLAGTKLQNNNENQTL
ncbi:MAG: hypothetical protein AAB453_03720 [Patescibacteria group bacterium]